MKDILFLEDDRLLAQSVVDVLQSALYSIEWVEEGDEAAEAAYAHNYLLYLFDVNVPGLNGFELLEQLRRSGDTTPTLFLTSRNQMEDLEHGFTIGADDYIKKPFDLHELLIRIKSKMPKTSRQYLSSHFAIDASSSSIYCYDVVKKLPAKEFALLSYLCQHQDCYLAPEDIIFALYEDRSISIATFRTYIKNLKRHLGECGIIENLKGVGYRFKVL
ncbi:MAG: DNA-binding response regulator [Sulfurimonas sp.]|nr:MAG: DNA-binding response regulator [Sulfurimonas sp.]